MLQQGKKYSLSTNSHGWIPPKGIWNVDQLFFTETAKLRDEFEALYATLFKRPENYLKVIGFLSDGRRSGMTRDEILKNTCTSSSHNTWKGHAFERVCLQHVNQIKAALGISGVQTNVRSWFVRGSKEQRGAQIDLVMQRVDGFTDIFEMKHSVNTFSIDNDEDFSD